MGLLLLWHQKIKLMKAENQEHGGLQMISVHSVTVVWLKCGSVSYILHRPLGKSIVHLIGFLDTGSVLLFLPAEIGFTWQG